ncbi:MULTISPECIES: septum site-determining protein MinC [Heyndrickxia]|jgi:septum site-determining protein MinC|uniref:Probable septum site-determining protein MinC n=1 Tax=Heyndrickxia oleronia TaxID=38875 RepID=A0A8E2I9T3_9BACI|nr:septum site-determining protein MinC [Heyndrickxia oleronia]NYV64437.1 septum site-determining protein MinC [Bacillus sp. Gen3]OJH17507.1 septum site-determining protein MinC [Bacillus obstructivus]MCI1590358.1 septum site-determining protein MinC [Heyndrickxia oleronia]MCI1614140.1 septum site-determining protein MinC [Heyndrickxia oleronia]MCI1745294.1 septum site-determining protein MinC [Heyndrickxia oleronia]
MRKRQNVMIKGTKEGLILHLNDQCSYLELKEELEEKLVVHHIENEESPLITVRIQVGNRYISPDQEEELKELVRNKRNLVVEEVQSNVITKESAEKMQKENEIYSVTTIVRSGQVLEVPGDLLLVGDVNPGGTAIAGGNIFIMGALKGVAHAGFNGNKDAVVAASLMMPSQIRISDCINRAPDQYGKEEQHGMECAYIDDTNHIVIDRIQVLKHLRPNITRFKGGY